MNFAESRDTVMKELDTLLGKVDPKQAEDAIDLIEKSGKIFVHGIGRAGYAGKFLAMRLAHMGRQVYVIGDTNTISLGENDLLIICSGSGETPQFILNANKTKSFGGNVLAFCGTPGSTLTQIADVSLIIPAPSKNQADSQFKSVQPMASLFEQGIVLVGDMLILTMASQATNNDEMFKMHANLE